MIKHFSTMRWIVILLFLPMAFGAQAQPDGKALFKANCAQCHNKNMKADLTGPALGGVQERWEDEATLYAWIRNSGAVIASGDAYANALFTKWSQSPMQAFPNLTDEEIAEILLYIDNIYTGEGKYAPAAIATIDGPEEGKESSPLPYYLLIGALVVLSLILARIISNLNYMNQVKMGEENAERKTIWQALTNKSLVGFVIFLLVLVGGYHTVNNAIDLGRQQGYAPTQPINFSHELHAGTHKIDCQYCHDGARRSKSAVIPAVNTCMNCHRAVEGETDAAKKEIGKIYAAAGWDPVQKVYTGDTKPIEWVRIHNLPDHVYFNHSQHVVAGGLECQTCHGPVEEMAKVEQFSPLSMGWCVNCHRQTEVKFADNDYYKSYELYHKDLKEGKMDKVTVEDIGGLECQKCHY
jgi:mono/diheme cytochrome c family protein